MLTTRRLALTLSGLGIINISLAYLLFYFSSVALLEERAKHQMESVRSLAAQKLSLNATEPLSDYAGLGKSGEVYLADRQGKIITASRHMSDLKDIRLTNNSFRQGLQGKTAVDTVVDYRGKEVLSAYAPFYRNGTQFVLISEIDKEEVLLPLRSLFPKVFMLCLFLCVLTLIAAYLFSARILRLVEKMHIQLNSSHLKVINAVEEEKLRISSNIHDGVGQLLTTLKWGIAKNETSEKLTSLCDEAFQEIRNISDDLLPVSLKESGCFPAIRIFLHKQEEFYGKEITFWCSSQLLNRTFRQGLDVNLYRMVQELLQNTMKHSDAGAISVVFLNQDDVLLFRYEDDGKGMPDDEPMPKVLTYRAGIMKAELVRKKTTSSLIFELTVPLQDVFV